MISWRRGGRKETGLRTQNSELRLRSDHSQATTNLVPLVTFSGNCFAGAGIAQASRVQEFHSTHSFKEVHANFIPITDDLYIQLCTYSKPLGVEIMERRRSKAKAENREQKTESRSRNDRQPVPIMIYCIHLRIMRQTTQSY